MIGGCSIVPKLLTVSLRFVRAAGLLWWFGEEKRRRTKNASNMFDCAHIGPSRALFIYPCVIICILKNNIIITPVKGSVTRWERAHFHFPSLGLGGRRPSVVEYGSSMVIPHRTLIRATVASSSERDDDDG